MSIGLLTGMVVAVLINLITLLFSRRLALKLIPWLCFYVAVYLAYEILTTNIIWIQAMKLASKYPPGISYTVVIIIAAILAFIFWYAVNKGLNKVDNSTIEEEKFPGNKEKTITKTEESKQGLAEKAVPPAKQNESPIEKLSQLGWTVKPGSNDIQFEIASKAIPNMEKSAKYFKQLQTPFQLIFRQVRGIYGLKFLSGASNCERIEISAVEFIDLSDLSMLSGLKYLQVSQTPFDGLSSLNLSPLSNLVNLQELNLNGSRFIDVAPLGKLINLKVLNLKDTPVRDITPLSSLIALQFLDITGTQINSLSPLTGMTKLNELRLGGKQVADLDKLSHLNSLTNISIIGHNMIDLSPIGNLVNLKSLFIWGPPRLNLSPLSNLAKLQQLTISGLVSLSFITDIEAISNLIELKVLTLGEININNLAFISKLTKLNDLNLGRMPITSIEPLRGLSSLKSLSLNSVSVVDISPLLDLPALIKLHVIGTPARSDVITELERRGVKVQR